MAMGSPAPGLSWKDWILGLLVVTWDALMQRVITFHLPSCLPITPLPHLTVIITGATSGIGLQTARHLAKSGAHVVFAVRNTNAAKELIEKWQVEQDEKSLPLSCEVMELDCLSLDSVRKFGESWESQKRPLNVLINNAGIFCMTGSQRFSEDGCEQHMQVNHLAPALLTMLLLPSLHRGSPSRVVMLNSLMHYLGYVDPSDLNLKGIERRYNNVSAYSASKLAQVMFSNLLHKSLPKEVGIDIICVHPGEVRTNVARDMPKIVQIVFKAFSFFFSPEEGARSVIFSATDKQVQDYARNLKGLDYPSAPYFGPHCKLWSVARQAQDLEKAYLVWGETLRQVGLPVECIQEALSGSSSDQVSKHLQLQGSSEDNKLDSNLQSVKAGEYPITGLKS